MCNNCCRLVTATPQNAHGLLSSHNPRSLRKRAPHLVVLVALLAFASPTHVAAAQVGDEPTPGIAETSAVAMPFVGTFEVWCTERNPSTGTCRAHHSSPAMDIGMTPGMQIYAAGAGTVLDVESECSASWCRGGAGLFVEIAHPDGTTSRYLHLSQVSVAEDDLVVAGDPIGLSGNSGSASAASPHLHYDEHFPRGTRIPFGPMLACIDDQVVEYPTVLGFASWNDVPFGTEITNEGFTCLGGAQLGSIGPDVLEGFRVFAVRPPALAGLISAEVEVTADNNGQSTTETRMAPVDQLLWFDIGEGVEYTIRQRTSQDGATWLPWSAPQTVDTTPRNEATCRGLYRTGANGTARIDVLVGSSSDDVLDGLAGADIICSGDGADIVTGGDGNDWIETGAGRDIIDAGGGRNHVFGGPNADHIIGGASRDRIVGGSGSDIIVGGPGPDLLIGSSGDDEIHSEAGRDRVKAGRGDDIITGGGGNDSLTGNGGADDIDGGSGIDVCSGAEEPRRCE
jgi:hypothetical protein